MLQCVCARFKFLNRTLIRPGAPGVVYARICMYIRVRAYAYA